VTLAGNSSETEPSSSSHYFQVRNFSRTFVCRGIANCLCHGFSDI